MKTPSGVEVPQRFIDELNCPGFESHWVLADWLEERGDPLAVALRNQAHFPGHCSEEWQEWNKDLFPEECWYWASMIHRPFKPGSLPAWYLPPPVMRELAEGCVNLPVTRYTFPMYFNGRRGGGVLTGDVVRNDTVVIEYETRAEAVLSLCVAGPVYLSQIGPSEQLEQDEEIMINNFVKQLNPTHSPHGDPVE